MSDPSPPLPPLVLPTPPPTTSPTALPAPPTPGPPVSGGARADTAATAAAAAPAPAPTEGAAAANLAQLLIRDPRHTVLVRVRGESMRGAGIHPGDLLVVERRPTASAGQVVVAQLRQGLTLKRLVERQGAWWLEAAHPDYPALALGEGRIWGVAVHRIRHLPPASGGPGATASERPEAMEAPR
jgi:phage repressor protein C with HTH and peptisase S24 domain